MYEGYWGLKQKPFQNTPNPRFVFYSSHHEEALVRMLYSVTESKGLMLLLGELGVGKSFIGHVFAREMRAKGYPVAFVRSPGKTVEEILSQVLYEFGVSYRTAKGPVQMVQRLTETAEAVAVHGRDLVLIIDEAELIGDPDAYDQIRRFLNITGEDRFLINVILAGTPDLWGSIVDVPGMRQHVGVTYRILPLSREESGEYIVHRLRCAGRDKPAFDAGAIDVIHSATRGVPREINTLCDLCLLIGSADEVDVVKPGLVEKAMDDMAGARVLDEGK